MENKLHEYREQIAKYKTKLDAVLKNNKDVYWKRTTEYLTGKINLNAYYFSIKQILPKNKAKLHNSFIISCIKATSQSESITLSNSQNQLKEGLTNSLTLSKRKRPTKEELEKISQLELKEIIKNLGRSWRERVKLKQSLSTENEHETNAPYFPTILPLTAENPGEYHSGVDMPLCIESKAFPTSEGLQLKANAMALENGLSGGAEEGVSEVILHGLETYLQNIITNCIEKRDSKKLRLSRYNVTAYQQSLNRMKEQIIDQNGTTLLDLHLNLDNNQKQVEYIPLSNTISTRDLLASFTISPHLLVEPPMALERLVATHNNASVRVKTKEEMEADIAKNRNRHSFF
ncbi:hypothetical protein K502DRAFT_364697 [Neoconidiobolus thromboides FSU 785]|nr:hypothetical protein K502DRAFT_364697 [Neoconidiobolus thromboides FSU 785]